MSRAKTIADGSTNVTVDSFPPAYDTVSLPAIRRRLRNLPDLFDYGSTSDMTSALNAASAASYSEGWRQLLVPQGVWTQGTAPAAINHGLFIEGEGGRQTTINVDHAGSAFYFTGLNGGAGGVSGFVIQIIGATNPLAAVRAEANAAGYSADGIEISNLWITYQSSGRWQYGLFLDGAPRNPGSGLQGLRDIHVDQIVTFGTTNDSLFIRNVKGGYFSRVLANGVGGSSRISLIGNSSADADKNNGIVFDGLTFGQLLINNTNGLVGTCTPQNGFNYGGGLTNCKLVVASPYQTQGPSTPPISGLELP